MEKQQAAQVLQTHLNELRAGRVNTSGDVQAALEVAVRELGSGTARTNDGSVDPHHEKGPSVSAEHAAALHSADTTRVAPVDVREEQPQQLDDTTRAREQSRARAIAAEQEARTQARTQDVLRTDTQEQPHTQKGGDRAHTDEQRSGEVHRETRRSK